MSAIDHPKRKELNSHVLNCGLHLKVRFHRNSLSLSLFRAKLDYQKENNENDSMKWDKPTLTLNFKLFVTIGSSRPKEE